jgi:hypothetical protein
MHWFLQGVIQAVFLYAARAPLSFPRRILENCDFSLSPPSPQRDGPYIYATLQARKVDDHSIVRREIFGVLPEGWKIADHDADAVRVCGTHPWQIEWLVFGKSGNCCYGTAACDLTASIGTTCELLYLTLQKQTL